MKFKDLPKIEICNKLKNVAFVDVAKNMSSYLFAKNCTEALEYFENERVKLIKKYGEEKDGKLTVLSHNMKLFTKDFTNLLESDVMFSIPKHNLEVADFNSENCFTRKEELLTGEEIYMILAVEKHLTN